MRYKFRVWQLAIVKDGGAVELIVPLATVCRGRQVALVSCRATCNTAVKGHAGSSSGAACTRPERAARTMRSRSR